MQIRPRRVSAQSIILALAAALVLISRPAWAGEAVALTDAELAQVDGGVAEPVDNPGVVITNTCGTCGLSLSGAAQQSANTVILVNAVNAIVAAQVNLSVRMGSPGATSQTNLSLASIGAIR